MIIESRISVANMNAVIKAQAKDNTYGN